MKGNKTKGEVGILQAFDMEKFFNNEGLIDTLYTIYTKGKSQPRTTGCGSC